MLLYYFIIFGSTRKLYSPQQWLSSPSLKRSGLTINRLYYLWDVPVRRRVFVYVTHLPRIILLYYHWDDKEKRWSAEHHPFTSPINLDPEELATNPKEALSQGYDMVLNGHEIGGGSIRIHSEAMQQAVFSILGISEEENSRADNQNHTQQQRERFDPSLVPKLTIRRRIMLGVERGNTP